MLPKLELAPILIYLVMLPNTFRPSMTPSPSTARLFSSNMISADSLAMSTALSTDMPTSAVFSRSVVDAIPQEADDVPLAVKGIDNGRLLRRRHLGEHRRGLRQVRQLFRRQRRHLAAENDAVHGKT